MCFGFGPYSFGYGSGASSFFPFLMMGIRLVVFIIFVALGVKLFKNFTTGTNNATKILDEKFAKGEISEEEYIKRKNFITQRS